MTQQPEPGAHVVLITHVAQQIFTGVSGKAWQLYPTLAQARVQSRYIRLAQEVVDFVQAQRGATGAPNEEKQNVGQD